MKLGCLIVGCTYVLLVCSEVVNGCTSGFMELDLLRRRAEKISGGQAGAGTGGELNREFRLLPGDSFSCSGIMTGLLLVGSVRTDGGRDKYPEIQIWRNTGGNTYTRQASQEIRLAEGDFSPDGVLQYNLNTSLSFQSGDVLGVYQPRQRNSVVRVYYDNVSPTTTTYLMNNDNPTSPINLPDLLTVTRQLILISPILGSSCTGNFLSRSALRQGALNVNINNVRRRNNQQRLFPNITFTCNGFITKWIVGAEAGSGASLPELQIWQNTGGSSYTKANFSILSSSTAPDSNNVAEYIPNPPLQFQEGDILGVYQPSTGRQNRLSTLVVYYQDRDGPVNYEEGNSALSTVTLDTPDNQYNYPLVTVEISTAVTPTSTILFAEASLTISVSETVITTTTMPDITMSVTTLNDITATSIEALMTTPSAMSDSIEASVPTSSAVTTSATPLSKLSRTVSFRGHSMSTLPATTAAPGRPNTGAQAPGNAVVVAVVVVVVIIAAMLAAVFGLVVILVIFRRRAKRSEIAYTNDGEDSLKELDNPMYSATVTDAASNTQQQPLLELYSTVEASDYETPVNTLNKQEQPVITKQQQKPTVTINSPIYQWGIVVPTLSQRKDFTDSEGHYEFSEEIYSSVTQDEQYQTLDHSFFKETVIYWEPANDCEAIYGQLADKRYREIVRQHIKIGEHLGSGQFGWVEKGVWSSPDGPVDVAIKTLKHEATEVEKVKFLQEAAIMGQFHHANIVTLHGVVTVAEPPMIVLELVKNGDLREYLHTFQPTPGELALSSLPNELLEYCRQIASGMKYLSKKSFVHRDLAARNILVDDQKTCKIADFGMSRDLSDSDYYVSQGGKIPIKWTAPEAVHFKKYSTASDVWSFGVLMYEVWSLGHKPFEEKTNHEAINLIDTGYRLPPPPGCPRAVYQLMMDCWHPEASGRLSFSIVVSRLSQPENQLLKQTTDKSSQSTMLGAPLETGFDLHSDLQQQYM